jgi:hypothetical protein
VPNGSNVSADDRATEGSLITGEIAFAREVLLISCVLVSSAPAAKRSMGESLAELYSTIISRDVTVEGAGVAAVFALFQAC